MVNDVDVLDATFAALAHPTRREIIARLAARELSVGELAEPFDISLPAISRHLRVLEEAGLIARVADGRLRRCRLDAGPMRSAALWIERQHRYWEKQLDALEKFLAETEKEESTWRSHDHPRRSRSASRGRSRPRVSGSGARGRKRRR